MEFYKAYYEEDTNYKDQMFETVPKLQQMLRDFSKNTSLTEEELKTR